MEPFITRLICLAILITGGSKKSFHRVRSAEIYHPSNISCYLPELPLQISQHSQDGPLACGGESTGGNELKSCMKWSGGWWFGCCIPIGGSWPQSHNFSLERVNHVSWATASGVYLIGGYINSRKTSLVKEDGSAEEGFKLKHQTV